MKQKIERVIRNKKMLKHYGLERFQSFFVVKNNKKKKMLQKCNKHLIFCTKNYENVLP